MLNLAQLYRLGINLDLDIYEGINLPENSPIDRETLINTIKERNGLNIPMYADPYVMQSAISVWSAKNQYTFIHIGNILNAEYNPIEDTDEDYNETKTHNLTDNTAINNTKSEAIHNAGTVDVVDGTTTVNSGTDTTTETDETSAFNASTYQDKDKSTTEIVHGLNTVESRSGKTTTGNDETKNSTAGTTNNKQLAENETTNRTNSGNLKYSHQELLNQEFELMGRFNPYNFIAGLFENELTLCLY